MKKNGEASLEEFLYEAYSKFNQLHPAQQKKYERGDVILTSYYSPTSRQVVHGGHRIVVITSKDNDPKYGGYKYTGFAMSSNTDHANKNKKSGFPDSLYIDNYDSILTWRDFTDTKPVMIDCSTYVKATSFDNIVGRSGDVKIGEVKPEFLEFIEQAYEDRGTGKNKNMYWIGGKVVNGNAT